jgi:hypothetical protein
MDGSPDREGAACWWWRPPPWLASRVVVLPPGQTRLFDESEWQDALVVVARGAVELEGVSGTRRRFGQGAVLWLAGVPLRALHGCGHEPAVLVATSRPIRPHPHR